MGDCTSQCTRQPFQQNLQNSVRIEYNGENFNISQNELVFDRQSTFQKVERAANSFCSQNNISSMYVPLLSRIIAYRHQRIFLQIWNKLPPVEKETFLEDLNSIQHDLMDSFYHHFIKNPPKQRKQVIEQLRIMQPKFMKENDIRGQDQDELKAIGKQLLLQNRVGLVLMCAGSSSRCNGIDKFLIPLELNQYKVTILDLFFERLLKHISTAKSIPIIISCNQYNTLKIQDYIKAKQYYGLNPQNFRYIETYSLAVFDTNGQYCIREDLRLIRRPSGTAVIAEDIFNRQIYSFLKKEGVQYLQFSGLQNLFQNPCDPLMLGLIQNEKRKVLAKCTRPTFYCQNLYRYYVDESTPNKVQLFNPVDAKYLTKPSIIQKLPVSMNSMIFELESLRNIVTDYNNSLFLAQKYRIIQKEESIFNLKRNRIQKSECYSFEKDIRDILSCVSEPLLFKVSRTQEYVPVNSINKEYSLSEATKHYKKALYEQVSSTNGSNLKYS